MPFKKCLPVAVLMLSLFAVSCQTKKSETTTETTMMPADSTPVSNPMVTHIYTADPSAHLFDGRVYVYPSHDIEAGIPENDLGDHFYLMDYHVLSMKAPGDSVTDHGVAFEISQVPWAGRQLWAPDAAYKDGKCFLYFPAKDKKDVFRIGVAVGSSPAGPFVPEANPIQNTFSIDPAVFTDQDGKSYMYFGGIWGGQLQRWKTGTYDPNGQEPAKTEPALTAKVARLSDDMTKLAETPKDVIILDAEGKPLLAGDNSRRFFEASWIHRFNGKYYFSYSTGDTHLIVYATGDNPYGPFTYQGVILKPVVGWTNHHSIIEVNGKWYLFYHDSMLSGGKTHLRSVKVTELVHGPDGKIETVSAYRR